MESQNRQNAGPAEHAPGGPVKPRRRGRPVSDRRGRAHHRRLPRRAWAALLKQRIAPVPCPAVGAATRVRDRNLKYLVAGNGATVTARFGLDGIAIGDPNRSEEGGDTVSSSHCPTSFRAIVRCRWRWSRTASFQLLECPGPRHRPGFQRSRERFLPTLHASLKSAPVVPADKGSP